MEVAVIKPRPPSCIKIRRTVCPNDEKVRPGGKIVNPVTHTAEAEVNRQSIKGTCSWTIVAIGRWSKRA